jgi:hypothetical protein
LEDWFGSERVLDIIPRLTLYQILAIGGGGLFMHERSGQNLSRESLRKTEGYSLICLWNFDLREIAVGRSVVFPDRYVTI